MGCTDCAQKRRAGKPSFAQRLKDCERDSQLAIGVAMIALYLAWSCYDTVKALRSEASNA